MSAAAFGHSKAGKRLCQRCRDRKARFAYRGRVKADRDHTLCFECYRAERDRLRQRALPFVDAAPARRVEMSQSTIEHRRRMLEHLASQAAR